MQHLVEICPEFRDGSYSAQRKLVLDLFDQAKYTIGQDRPGLESQAVEFASMFRGGESERSNRQRLMRSKFLYLVMARYRHRIIKRFQR